MHISTLGQSDLKVSQLCLGSMTWGTQNTAEEAHAQIDMALDHGVNFIDTAEMYPVNPLLKKTQGDSERILGQWLAKSGRRGDVIVATKISGAGHMNVRDGAPISAETIEMAVEESLRSLQTDVIDLYQLHWPNRGSYAFRQNWTFDPTEQDKDVTLTHMADVLQALQKLVQAGKIRHFGLSNESTWGTAQWLRLAEENGWPRVVSVQNEYSLLCRHFDLDMAELAHNECVDLLAFSPMAAGILTGKYAGNVVPAGSRRSHVEDMGGRINTHLWPAHDAYIAVAQKHGLQPGQMALAWCLTRPFMGSAIFGATTAAQLELALQAADLTLSTEVMTDLQDIHRKYPAPV